MAIGTRRLGLADVVDLEAQLARDAGTGADALHRRDRALVGGATSGDRAGLVKGWLEALRASAAGRDLPGRAVVRALRTVGALLVLAGLVVGSSTATLVLGYDGARPVNVWDVLLVLVGVQLVLLALLLVSLAAPVGSLGVPLLGLSRWLAQRLWRALAQRSPGVDARQREIAAVVARVRARQRLYGRLETWTLFALTQAFGVAFNVGALVAFLRLVTFTDLVFAWSTTLDVDAGAFHRIAAVLATPWQQVVPDAVPGLDLVEATRWSRLTGAFVGGAGPAASVRAGGWWRFLLLAVITYGLVPRLCTLTLATLRRRWLLGRLPLDDVEVQGLLDRLSLPVVSTRAGAAEVVGEVVAGSRALPRPPAGTGGSCVLVLWRDTPRAVVEPELPRGVGSGVRTVFEAGGRRGPGVAALVSAIASAADGDDRLLVACESWEAPDAALLELVAELRRAVGLRRWIVVVLVGAGSRPPTAAEVDLWSRRLASLADPYTALAPLMRAP